ncbi:hypothetical protein AB0H71_28630 [Nocardia sp. NPDC050697]|uniref:hypothetical protein n=1 Tax=Nocardia sp. NPDC050697 TaxID=3155158 RepID=UPI0033D01BBB
MTAPALLANGRGQVRPIRTVGVLRETAPGERRVALTPDAVRRLVHHDLSVTVETNAGVAAGFPDADYAGAGARIGAAAADAGRADIVAWVKTPAFDLGALRLRPGTTLVGFQDPHHRPAEIAELARHGIRSVVFEFASRAAESAEFDALTPMSRLAGAIAYEEARALLPPGPRRHPLRAVILGFGAAGRAAFAAAVAAGDAPPVVVGASAVTAAAAGAAGVRRYLTSNAPGAVPALLRELGPDIVLCAALHRGEPAPRLVDDAALTLLAPGTVVVDLAAKAGGNCSATRRDTTHTLPNGVIVTHRSNYPAARPAEASHAYAAATAATILRLAAGGALPMANPE